MSDTHKLFVPVVLYYMISTVLSSHFRGGIIMVRSPDFDETRGSGEGPVMSLQEYQVSDCYDVAIVNITQSCGGYISDYSYLSILC